MTVGQRFTAAQMEWLTMIKEHIAASLAIEMGDFELSPFYEKGGPGKAHNLFKNDLQRILSELNEELAA